MIGWILISIGLIAVGILARWLIRNNSPVCLVRKADNPMISVWRQNRWCKDSPFIDSDCLCKYQTRCSACDFRTPWLHHFYYCGPYEKSELNHVCLTLEEAAKPSEWEIVE